MGEFEVVKQQKMDKKKKVFLLKKKTLKEKPTEHSQEFFKVQYQPINCFAASHEILHSDSEDLPNKSYKAVTIQTTTNRKHNISHKYSQDCRQSIIPKCFSIDQIPNIQHTSSKSIPRIQYSPRKRSIKNRSCTPCCLNPGNTSQSLSLYLDTIMTFKQANKNRIQPTKKRNFQGRVLEKMGKYRSQWIERKKKRKGKSLLSGSNERAQQLIRLHNHDVLKLPPVNLENYLRNPRFDPRADRLKLIKGTPEPQYQLIDRQMGQKEGVLKKRWLETYRLGGQGPWQRANKNGAKRLERVSGLKGKGKKGGIIGCKSLQYRSEQVLKINNIRVVDDINKNK